MVQAARRRAAQEGLGNVSFMAGDAQDFPLPAGSYDVAISRFGLMFFDDPEAGFANLARALAPAGRLAFTCWQDALSNPFVAVPGLALAGHVALPDLGPPGSPGMFALADPARIRSLLTAAGLADADDATGTGQRPRSRTRCPATSRPRECASGQRHGSSPHAAGAQPGSPHSACPGRARQDGAFRRNRKCSAAPRSSRRRHSTGLAADWLS